MGYLDRRRRAQAHANHAYFCTCGRIVRGNGGKANHGYMHEQARDGHRFVVQRAFDALFPGWGELPWPERTARKVNGPRVPA